MVNIPSDLINRIPEILDCGLMVMELEGDIIYSNPWLDQRLGHTSAAGDGETLAGILREVVAQARMARKNGDPVGTAACTVNGTSYRVEVSLLGKNELKDSAVCLIMPESSGSPFQDMVAHTLQSQELNAIFELSSDGILLCDGEGRIVKINEASARLNGWSAAEVVGRTVQDLLMDGLIDKSVTHRVLQTQKTVDMMQFIGRTQKHLLVTGTPLFDKTGRIKLVLVNERDLTQLNAIKAQLEETQRVSDKYKDNLAELAVLESRDGLIKAESQAMIQVLQYAMKLARLDASNILVTGESGVGKGLLAQFMHNQGQRQGQPFIQINCAAMPESLLEAELFGYEKGAFTGAGVHGKAGLFELAHTGTLFLDEIGDCPLAIQAKLLKYLDDHEVLRLGSVKPRLIDCTIIAATNRDLAKLIEARHFRSDLFYRLNTFNIHIPPLRDRPEDTFELIMHFLDEFNSRYGFEKKISSNALHRLQHHGFPGNVRELRNIIKQAVVMSENDVLDSFILGGLPEVHGDERSRGQRWKKGASLSEQIGDFERQLLLKTLSRSRTTRELAHLLGTSQPTIVRRLKKYGLPLPAKQN